MITYATTYGWRSTGVRRDLITKPPELNPVNGGQRVPMGVYGTTDPITTNQKVAGSSPAERAKEIPAICRVKVKWRKRVGLIPSPFVRVIL